MIWSISHKDHLEVCFPNSRLLSGLYGMWSSMEISLHISCYLYLEMKNVLPSEPSLQGRDEMLGLFIHS